MKIQKRDGRVVPYEEDKIREAIHKANNEVEERYRASEGLIEEILEDVQQEGRQTQTVEHIQDMIEEHLVEHNKYTLAKKYIVYRYQRSLLRKSNTTDESILKLIRNENKELAEENSNKNTRLASTQRDYIAGEVSRDVTRRLLLPEHIAMAHDNGVLHFHDADYFIQPIFNCCLINIKDMLDNGTSINGKMIESPKSFQVACTVTTQIIAAVASNQYGGQSVNIKHLGKYLRKSREKFAKQLEDEFGDTLDQAAKDKIVQMRLHDELKSGVQTIQYQINTLMTTNGQSPFVTLFLHIDENDEYVEETVQIIMEILRQRIEGTKNEKGVYVTPAFPKLVYVLDENNCLKGGKYDYVTKLAAQCSAKRMYPDYISAKKMRENYEGNVFSCMGCRSFLFPWKDENGNYNNANLTGPQYNPMGHIWEIDSNGYRYTSRIQGYVDVTILKGLTFRMTQGFTFGDYVARSTYGRDSYTTVMANGDKTSATATSTQNYSWTNQNILSYVKEFNKNHRINATAVIEQQYSNNMNNKSEGRELISEEIGANNTSLAKKVYGSSGHTRSFMLSYMARVNYVLMNRYMLTASWRYDGSSNLSSEKRWEQFPSMALAWNMKEESFLRGVDFLSQLKLRVGYGETGNQAVAAYSAWTELEATRDANDNLTLTTKRIGTKGLRWERTKQWNAGIDFGVFNNRLTFTVDVYDKLTKDALLDVTAPLYTGFKTRLKNAAEIRNKGFEVTIGADPVATRDFRWNTNITLSHNKGVIESLDGDLEYAIISGGYQNDYFRNIKGEKLGTMWGYVSDGVWKTSELADAPQGTEAGSYRYKNLDGSEDKQITVEDQTIIGNGQPSFQWGWNNTLTYKNFDLGIFVMGVHGFDIYNYTREARFASGGLIALGPNPEWANRWTPENENTDIVGFVNGINALTPSSQFVEKGDFVKVKSITLGYSLSNTTLSKAGISKLRVYASIQNPFLFTGYSGIDPEVTLKSPLTSGIDWGYYPNGRNYMLGFNFSF